MNKDFLGCVVTDGIDRFRKTNECYWIFSDVIAVVMTELKDEDFLNCVLRVKDNQAELIIDDGNGNLLYSQEYGYTDFPHEKVKFYAEKNELGTFTLMFPEER